VRGDFLCGSSLVININTDPRIFPFKTGRQIEAEPRESVETECGASCAETFIRHIIRAMKQPEEPLAWWEHSQTRKTVAIVFLVALSFALIAIFPVFDSIYENHAILRDFLAVLITVLGLSLAVLELRHSGEANEHRGEQNRLTEMANSLRNEANKYREDANRLRQETLELQQEIHQLQKKLTAVRVYVRADMIGDGPRLRVENLSEFDLWINQVELIVTVAGNDKAESRTIGGATRISRGHAEDGYKLYGTLMLINGNRGDSFDMKFHIKVVAKGLADDPVAINSPEYHFLVRGNTRELKVSEY
jgi:hypothetical protein